MNALAHLIKKEIQLEIRRPTVLFSLLLHLAATVYIGYLSFAVFKMDIPAPAWVSLYWIILLFVAIQTVSKSFIRDKSSTVYEYSIVSPHALFFSKVIYYTGVLSVFGLAEFLLMTIWLQSPVQVISYFVVLLFLMAIGLSSTLCFLSAMAAPARNSFLLITVLSLPVLITLFLFAVQITKNCVDDVDALFITQKLLSLVGINLFMVALSYLLFPYIWRS